MLSHLEEEAASSILALCGSITLTNTVEGMQKVFTDKVSIFCNQYDILFEMTSHIAMRHCFQQQ